ncbi:MAG: hypothetical protein ACRBBK_07370 [Paracoccaceae bacterium]
MAAFVAPQLLGKLKLLIRYGRFENLGAIANEFGITEGAVRYWTKMTDGQLAGTIPQNRVSKLIELFSEILSNHSLQDIATLLEGPIADFEDALRVGDYLTLRHVLYVRADARSGKLIPIKTSGMGLVVANRLSAKAHCKFPMGQSFRLEFATQNRGRYLLGLQKSPQAWGCIETVWSEAEKLVHMPGSTETDDLGSLDESTDDGVSEFYVLQSNRPFPTVFAKALMDEVPLGRTELSLLAEHLRDSPKTDVHFMRFDVEFTSPINSSG